MGNSIFDFDEIYKIDTPFENWVEEDFVGSKAKRIASFKP